VSWLEDGVRVESQTMDPTSTVLRLAERFGGEVPGLEVRRETLEDVYLAMIAEDRGEAVAEVDVE
jgi:ABC-2 type transport system ATP-binding protein